MHLHYNMITIENILKGSLDLIESRFDPITFTFWENSNYGQPAEKFAWGIKAKHCWALSTNFWKQKVCRHHPAVHRGAIYQFLFRWVYYCHSSECTGKKTGKTHLWKHVAVHLIFSRKTNSNFSRNFLPIT